MHTSAISLHTDPMSSLDCLHTKQWLRASQLCAEQRKWSVEL